MLRLFVWFPWYLSYCKHSVFLNIFRYPDYMRPTLHWSIDNDIFFMTTPTENMLYFSVLLTFKHVNLILWLKVYVAFNDLHNLKILLCECEMSFKIDNLRYVKNIEKKSTQYQLPPFLEGAMFSPKFWKGTRKKWVPGRT